MPRTFQNRRDQPDLGMGPLASQQQPPRLRTISRPQGPGSAVAQSNASKRRRRLINLHIHGIDLIEHDRRFACGMIK